MPGVGLVVTDSAAPAVGRWSLPTTKTRMSTRRQGDKRRSEFAWGSLQTEPPCQHLKRILNHLLRVLPKLTVKFRVIVCVHTALERFGVSGAIKEPRCDPQCTDTVTGSPSATDFVSLAMHAAAPRSECANCQRSSGG